MKKRKIIKRIYSRAYRSGRVLSCECTSQCNQLRSCSRQIHSTGKSSIPGPKVITRERIVFTIQLYEKAAESNPQLRSRFSATTSCSVKCEVPGEPEQHIPQLVSRWIQLIASSFICIPCTTLTKSTYLCLTSCLTDSNPSRSQFCYTN